VPRVPETVGLTLLALLAFASNSILTRMALGPGSIDAASFTLVRLASGGAILWALTRATPAERGPSGFRHFAGPLALFAYAAPFSFAYLRIGAAVGALVLFGVVQLTMVACGLTRGERPSGTSLIGLAFAVLGLCWLTLPSAQRPDTVGLVLMIVAGVAWGAYSLLGKESRTPLASNARSFLLSVPLALVLLLLHPRSISLSPRGAVLALVSGAVTSGLGYAVWYRALAGLRATQAAVVQLSVPVLAGLGAVIFLGEALTSRLLMSGACILGGIALFLGAKHPQPRG
jgi:drug/metabolite transporter (DMT)-like permease